MTVRRVPIATVNAMLSDAAWMVDSEIVIYDGVKISVGVTGSPLRLPRIGVAAHIEIPRVVQGKKLTLQLSVEDPAGMPIALGERTDLRTKAASPILFLEYGLDATGPVAPGSTTVRVPFCANFTNLALPSTGLYQFVLSIGDIDACRLAFKVTESTGSE